MININRKVLFLIITLSILVQSCMALYPVGKNYPHYVGTYYILSNYEFGKVKEIITLNYDGSANYNRIENRDSYNINSWEMEEDNNLFVMRLFNKNRKSNSSGIKITLMKHNTTKELYKNIPFIRELGIYKYSSNSRSNNIYSYIKDSDQLQALQKIKNDTWNKIDKNSIREIAKYLKEGSNSKEAKQLLENLLDDKIVKYFNKKYRSFVPYMNSMIYLNNGTELCTLSDSLKLPILSINNDTGFKIDFDLKKKKNKIVLIITGADYKKNHFIFRPYKGKLIAESYISDEEVNPKNWEYGLQAILMSFNTYPNNESIDFDLLDSLK